MQSWYYLAGAILLEVAGTTSMKLSSGFEKVIPSILIIVFYSLSFLALTYALKKIDVSVAYAIWSGIGTAMIAFIGIMFFKESVNSMKIISILLVIIGVIGLHYSAKTH